MCAGGEMKNENPITKKLAGCLMLTYEIISAG
jgi:hypothetical protein